MTVKLFITGGTIDKVYNRLTGELVFENTHIVEMLNRSGSTLDIVTEVLFLKDSLEMTDRDRELIVSKCLDCDRQHIIITHGTDTMVETAKLLDQHIKHKTIVLFGAMIPYAVKNSEALFNLGAAISVVQLQKSGIYIAMNGQVFKTDKVEKNKDLGIFQ